MAVQSNNKQPATSTDIASANITSGMAPSQVKGPLLGPMDQGFVSPDDYDAICEAILKAEGDPVDVFFGRVVNEVTDLTLPGAFAIEWKRFYNGAFIEEWTPLGRGGWTHSLNQWVEQDSRGWRLRNEDGRFLRFDELEVGASVVKRSKRLEIHRDSEAGFRVTDLESQLSREYHADVRPGKAWTRAWLRKIADPRGNAAECFYDGGRLRLVTDTAKRELRFEYDGSGQLVQVLLWTREQVHWQIRFSYHPTGELASATDALGHTERYEYDGLHRIVRVTHKNGVSFHYQYDGETGLCTKTWGDGGLHTFRFVRERKDDQLIVTTTGANEPRIRTFNLKGDLLHETNFEGSWEQSWEYDDQHVLLSTTNAALGVTQYQDDERGNPVSMTDPAGNVTRWEHLGDRVSKLIAPDGSITRYSHNQFGELVAVEYPAGARYSFDYDRWGHIVAVHDDQGCIARYTYDAEHNLLEETDARGATWMYEVDALGRRTSRTDPLGQVTRVEYDASGQVTRVMYPSGASVQLEYEPHGNVVRMTDELGRVTTQEFSGTGCLAKRTTPDGQVWQFAYDTSERLIAVKNPQAERHEFLYDSAGRIVEERTLDGRRMSYRYDAVGRLTRIEQPDGSWRSYRYDALGNVIEEDSSHGTQSYERDALGRLRRAVLVEGPEQIEVEWTLDEFGRRCEERQGDHVLRYSFDAQGRRVSRDVPGVGTTTYRYGVDSALSTVRHETPEGNAVELSFECDRLGREVLLQTSDHRVAVESSYDSLGNLVERKIQSGASGQSHTASLGQRSWEYDGARRVVAANDSRWGARRYHHDELNQLTRVQSGRFDDVFEYKVNGALERAFDALNPSQSPNGPGTWLIAEGNVLKATDRHEYEYDACHRRTAKIDKHTGTRQEYLWDCRDRLREVRQPDGSRVRYFYDALGRRVRKEEYPAVPPLQLVSEAQAPEDPVGPSVVTVAAKAVLDRAETVPDEEAPSLTPSERSPFEPTVTRLLWDRDELAAELDEQDQVRGHVHYPSTFVPMLQIDQGQPWVVVTDPLGTPRDLVSTSGAVVWSAEYTPWGKIREEFADAGAVRKTLGDAGSRAEIRSPFRMLGQLWDEETGLGATRFRMWDPDTGRWLSPDPLGLLGGNNLMGFDGSPVLGTDAYGLLSDQALQVAANLLHKAGFPGRKSARQATTAVVEAVDANGNKWLIVSTNRGSPSSVAQARARELFGDKYGDRILFGSPSDQRAAAAAGFGTHAEATGIAKATNLAGVPNAPQLTPTRVAASREVCPTCTGVIGNQTGMRSVTPSQTGPRPSSIPGSLPE